jgi:hypothetical protein
MMGRKAARNVYIVVRPIKLEFSASVGFIHKKYFMSTLQRGELKSSDFDDDDDDDDNKNSFCLFIYVLV